MLGSIFSNRRGEGEDTFLLCDQVLLADFLDFQMLFLVGWSARVFWRGVVFRIFRVSPENPGRGGAHSACFLDFLILFLGGNARHFLRAFSVGFCLWFARMPTRRDICHHFVSFGAIFVNVCVFFVACFSFFGAHGTLPGHFSHKLAHFSSAWGRKATMC